MNITVAVCTWNRAELLAQTLESLTELKIPADVDWQLLVVNNGCSDDTDQVVDRFAARLPVQKLYESTPGKSHAANLAIERAAGDWLLFTDDDVLVDSEWLTALRDTAERVPSAAAIGGPISPWFPVEPRADVLEAFPIARGGFCRIDHGTRERILDDDERVYGANLAFNLAALGSLRFDPALGPKQGGAMQGEELDLIGRIRARGGPVAWSPGMRVRHYVDPRRLTVDYLVGYYGDHARMQVRLGNVPPGPWLFGAPRWLWRALLLAYLRAQWALATGASDRLMRLRDWSHLRGTFLECRVRGRRLTNQVPS